MFYEPNPKKKRKAQPKEVLQPTKKAPKVRTKRRGCLSGLFRLAFTLAVIGMVLLLASGVWVRVHFLSLNRPDLAVNVDLPGDYTHVLLLGADQEEGGTRSRTDSIMVASFGQAGDIKLTSFMRDTMLDMGKEGEHKLNAAYRIGGGDLAMYSINKAFGLNVVKYAVVDFQGIAAVIDAMGGIELTISKQERDQINQGLRGAYKKKRVFNGVLMEPLEKYGKDIHMSGTHALFYARIRSIDSDFQRAQRQRTLLMTMMQRLKANPNPVVLARVLSTALSCVETNLSPVDMAALGVRALSASKQIEQYRMPPEGAYKEGTEGGVWMIRANLSQCRKKLHTFIYE